VSIENRSAASSHRPLENAASTTDSGNAGGRLRSLRRRAPHALIIVLICLSSVGDASARGMLDEHSKHHPGQANDATPQDANTGGGMGGGGMGGGGMDGGGMGGGGMGGGGMGGMMEKMGAPKPREIYPRLMSMPDLPMEDRAKIEAEAHQRMIDGTELMSSGFDQLTAAAPGQDFDSMQTATASVREGLAQFESGLAAHRAIAEGKSPHNVALQWFKRDMNLMPPAAGATGFHFFGMTPFHTSIMLLLVIFAGAMIWMYFFKMRRAADLMQTLANSGEPSPNADSQSRSKTPVAAAVSAAVPPVARTVPPVGPSMKARTGKSTAAVDDCCDESSVACADENTSTDDSQGLLRVAKRKLCRLRVARIYRETDDVKTFRLVACHGGALPFSYLPGQFLTLTLPVSEKPVRRSYTISSSPTQGYHCEVTVKREDQGLGSRYLHDRLKEGDTLEVQAPSGKFFFTGTESDSVVLIGGGVGITPMMSIARALTDMGWPGDICFVVACRDPEHFIFEDELKRLQQRHANLHVHVAMSRIDADRNGYRKGRVSKELLQEWIPDIATRRIHLCGAPPMMATTRKILAELGVPEKDVHTENFGSLHKPRAKTAEPQSIAPKVGTPSEKQTAASVTFRPSGKSTQLAPDDTVLEAAERIDIDIDNSCRVGSCGLCAVKLLSGHVTMEVDDGLDPDEKVAGMILACQAKSKSDVTVEV
jgi:ferredoxin-NADP reductase